MKKIILSTVFLIIIIFIFFSTAEYDKRNIRITNSNVFPQDNFESLVLNYKTIEDLIDIINSNEIIMDYPIQFYLIKAASLEIIINECADDIISFKSSLNQLSTLIRYYCKNKINIIIYTSMYKNDYLYSLIKDIFGRTKIEISLINVNKSF